MTRKFFVSGLLMPVLLAGATGCVNPGLMPGHEVTDYDPGSPMLIAGASSMLIVRNPDGTLCYGPAPDAAFTDSTSRTRSISLSLVSTGNDARQAGFESAHARLALGGRNPNVLVTRDILFASCLLEQRANLDDAARLELFKATLATLERINAKSLDGENIVSDTSQESFTAAGTSLNAESDDSD